MDIRKVIQSQYQASIDMLGQAIEICPPEIWHREEDKNKFWHLAYHTIFYTHLYISPSEADFIPWEKHRPKYHSLDTLPAPAHTQPTIVEQYTKAEIQEYLDHLRRMVNELINTTDLHAESGFEWLPFSKLELQFYNIRHLMQHTGELCERLGHAAHIEIDWVGKHP